MTDATLTWQTERFLDLETHRVGHVVNVRRGQVVEIVLEGAQRPTRYPRGMGCDLAEPCANATTRPPPKLTSSSRSAPFSSTRSDGVGRQCVRASGQLVLNLDSIHPDNHGGPMLTARYLPSTRNLDAILDKIIGGVAPDKFTVDHLKAVGFASSNDRAVIPLLKDLGFLAADGSPTPRYHAFRDRSKSKTVMAESLREAYADVFHVSEKPTASDRAAVEGLFKSKLNSSDKVAQVQAMTFYALLSRADLNAEVASQALPAQVRRTDGEPSEPGVHASTAEVTPTVPTAPRMATELHYTIQVHLPATKDLEVYNAIFRSLRENLLV